MSAPDVLLPFRHGESGAEELRYALRSIDTNVEVRHVWVIGDCPDWYVGKHLATERHPGKYRDQTRAWEAYAAERTTRTDALLWYDDLFAMQPVEPTLLHSGPITEHPRIGAERGYDGKRTETARKYRTALNLDGHWPMPLTKAGIRATLPTLDTDADHAFKRTVYGVINGTAAAVEAADCKVGRADVTSTLDQIQGPYLSTNDATFLEGDAGRLVRATFTAPSRWER